jgi:UDP-glucose 4-epimerase
VTTSLPTIILTGATGFIGSAVLAELIDRGAQPIVLVRKQSNTSRIDHFKESALISYQQLNEPELIPRLRMYQPEVFIHCAWRGVLGQERNAEYQVTENIPLTLDSVKLSSECGCRQWIGLGSQAEYGNPNHILTETTPLQPTTCYGKAKLAAGIASLALCNALGLIGTWLRVFSTYGPGDHPQWFVPYVIREFLAGRAPELTPCEQYWDYLFVQDAARAIISVTESRPQGVFNLGSGYACSLKRIVESIRAELGTALQAKYGAVSYRPDQVMHLQADITRLAQVCGWHPEVSLEEGLRRTVEWYRQNA